MTTLQAIAAENKLKTIAFPAVGTGIAGFPVTSRSQPAIGWATATPR